MVIGFCRTRSGQVDIEGVWCILLYLSNINRQIIFTIINCIRNIIRRRLRKYLIPRDRFQLLKLHGFNDMFFFLNIPIMAS